MKNRNQHHFMGTIGKALAVLLETVALILALLLGVIFVVEKGPSPAARDLFVMSVRETSAVGFLADLFLSEEEIAAIEQKPQEGEAVEVDTSLISLPKEEISQGPVTDAWGLCDEDGDVLILQ